MTKILKGEGFLNRYRFTGTLTTQSPLHVGSGVATAQEIRRNAKKPPSGEMPMVARVMKDHRGKPLIPGSALRGVMRHWLLNVLGAIDQTWAATHDYEDPALIDLSQDAQIQKVKNDFSWLELLFGTPFHEGKLEVWDAPCLTGDTPHSDTLLAWNKQSLTYIDISVAIDPETGTTLDGLLYHMEVVPPGVAFEVNLMAQNLSTEELGLVLLALQAFNSQIYPIRIGAHGGRGYGRLAFQPGKVYGLDTGGLHQWLHATIGNVGADHPTEAIGGTAGAYALPLLSSEEQQVLITAAKEQITSQWRRNHV